MCFWLALYSFTEFHCDLRSRDVDALGNRKGRRERITVEKVSGLGVFSTDRSARDYLLEPAMLAASFESDGPLNKRMINACVVPATLKIERQLDDVEIFCTLSHGFVSTCPIVLLDPILVELCNIH